MMQTPRSLVLMGPAGCGKSTIGRLAADILSLPFLEGDDYHTEANIAVMAAGGALSDEDRLPWIAAIGRAAGALPAPSCVLACSALSGRVRAALTDALPAPPVFALLDVPRAELSRRLATRQGHFAGPDFLASQLAALDAAPGAQCLDGMAPPEAVAQEAAALFLSAQSSMEDGVSM